VRARTIARLLLVALLAPPMLAPAQQQRSVMDRVVARFQEGRPMSFAVMFETLATEHDLDFNTVVAEASERNDKDGRALLVTTESYRFGGARHRFVFVIRDGLLTHFDLQKERGGEWEPAAQDQFWFQRLEASSVPTDFLAGGDAVLYARGACNQGRGAPTRARATMALRSFAVDTGQPLQY
jgi:hypothetical protein